MGKEHLTYVDTEGGSGFAESSVPQNLGSGLSI